MSLRCRLWLCILLVAVSCLFAHSSRFQILQTIKDQLSLMNSSYRVRCCGFVFACVLSLVSQCSGLRLCAAAAVCVCLRSFARTTHFGSTAVVVLSSQNLASPFYLRCYRRTSARKRLSCWRCGCEHPSIILSSCLLLSFVRLSPTLPIFLFSTCSAPFSFYLKDDPLVFASFTF